MPEQRPLTCGCLRFRLALSEAEDLFNYKLPIAPVARACRLLHCPAFDPDSASCNPNDDRSCQFCPGSIFAVQPDVKKDEPT